MSEHKGTIKWFDYVKGYGFITPDDGSSDKFVHITSVKNSGISIVKQGQKVSYELQPDSKGNLSAANLSVSEEQQYG